LRAIERKLNGGRLHSDVPRSKFSYGIDVADMPR